MISHIFNLSSNPILARCMLVLFIVVTSLTSVSLTADEQVHTFSAEYDAYQYGDKVGFAQLSLESLGDNTYQLNYFSSVSKYFLSDKRRETSIFTIKNNALIPINYHFSRKGFGPNKSLKALFDSSIKKIVINDEPTFDWSGETDNQLYRIDIARQLAKNKTSMKYDFLNYRGDRKTYFIEVVGEESLSLPYGQLDTIKVKVNRESKKRETFAWYSPSLNYALVRLQQFKEGEEQGDILLKSYTD